MIRIFSTPVLGAAGVLATAGGIQNMVTSGGQWSMELKNNKSGWATCAK